ncbi:MAG: RluA family pseudouridine synthase [Eubacteriales bacterium]|nr:RluA family pseudouridine synthase [Eubacteriales bacterium]
MGNYKVIIDEEQKGTRIDLVLSLVLEDTSRSFIQKLLETGNVTVNGKTCDSKKYKVKLNDTIDITIPEIKELKIEGENIPLEIVYEDEDVLVVNKPKGMVVHPATGNYSQTLVNALINHCGENLSTINGKERPGIVHRIDKDTSGLLMIAKNNMSHEILSKQLAAHSTKRTYQALVYHNFNNDEGTIDAPIGRDPKNRLRQAVTPENSKNAVTHYRVLKRFGKYTLIEANLETGRTHQIRVHMAYIKHPLVGDLVYGPAKQKLSVEGQMLHAKTLGFVHPKTGEYMVFDSELPAYFTEVLQKIRKEK